MVARISLRNTVAALALLALPTAMAEVTWDGSIQAVVEAKCVKCHGRLLPQGGLKLNSRRNLLKGGNSGPALVPGNANASLMFRQFGLPVTDPKHMPPAAEPQLTQREIELFRAWIDGGAK